MEKIVDLVINWLLTTGVKILVAIILLFISFKIINVVIKKIKVFLEKQKKLDTTLTNTLCYALGVVLKGLVIICLIDYVGIETSSISAVFASLGVAAGLAVNGTLSNLAGGVMILITRPFSVGDYIAAQGMEGTVENIYICNTKIFTVDNKTVYLPNSALSTGTITNYSEKKTRRIDFNFSIAGNNPKTVRQILLNVANKHELVLKNPEPFARITDYGAGNGTIMVLRVWTNTKDYWTVYHDLLDGAQEAFESEGIIVPFAQLDVHMK